MSKTIPGTCDTCGAFPVVAMIDGDCLCKNCADNWCRSEGDHARYIEEEGNGEYRSTANPVAAGPNQRRPYLGHAGGG